jgi:hypothetical protein
MQERRLIVPTASSASGAEGYEVRAFCVQDAIPQFKPLIVGSEDLFLGIDDPTYYRVRGGVHIRGAAYVNLAKEQFDQLWNDPRLFKLRTALGDDELEVRRLAERVTKLGAASPI